MATMQGMIPDGLAHPDGAMQRACVVCSEPFEINHRIDKKYCESACRALRWARAKRKARGDNPKPDYEELIQYLRALPQYNGDRPCGYSLCKRFGNVGEVSFPEGGRRTKRTPDEHGDFCFADRPYYINEPFEAPRVPATGIYVVKLHFPGGKVVPTNRMVEIMTAFPSVRLYDRDYLYDISGKKFNRSKPKQRSTPTSGASSEPPKPRKSRRQRNLQGRRLLGTESGLATTEPGAVAASSMEMQHLAMEQTWPASIAKQNELLLQAQRVQAEQATQIRELRELVHRNTEQAGSVATDRSQVATFEQLLMEERKERAAERAAQAADKAELQKKERWLSQTLEQVSARLRLLEQERDQLRESLRNQSMASGVTVQTGSTSPPPAVETGGQSPIQASERQAESLPSVTNAERSELMPLEQSKEQRPSTPVASTLPPVQNQPTVPKANPPSGSQPQRPPSKTKSPTSPGPLIPAKPNASTLLQRTFRPTGTKSTR